MTPNKTIELAIEAISTAKRNYRAEMEGRGITNAPCSLYDSALIALGDLKIKPSKKDAEIAALKAENARLREACNKATEIERLALSIERGEEWTGGEPTLGTCKILGKIKAIGITCMAALAASPVEAEQERGPEEGDIIAMVDATDGGWYPRRWCNISAFDERCLKEGSMKAVVLMRAAELQRRIEAER